MEDFTKTLEQSKRKLRAALNGHYIDRNDYLSDKTRPNGKVPVAWKLFPHKIEKQ